MRRIIKFLRNAIPDTHPIRLLYHKILAFLAAVRYWYPADKLIVVGVTGTNGKTTTVNLITNVLNEAGYKVGMTSTINFQIASKRWVNDTKQTTLGPFFLQKMLRRMIKAGCRYAVLEVSSHSITQSRIYGVNIDIAVITNVSPEHVEYHGSFNNYLNTKGRLFQKVSKDTRKFGVPKVLITNVDDKYYSFFDQFVADRKLTYGVKGGTVHCAEMDQKPEGTHFILRVPNNSIPVDLRLPGEFNVANALAAAAVGISLQVPLDVIKKALDKSATVSGRFEHVDSGQKYSIIVDYAHTPPALESLFSLYRKLTKGKLYAVFGATGGGRDKSKRPEMGKIVDQYADYIIVTDDDPYDENEWDIIDQVSKGISREEGNNFWKIADRREAIRLALTLAKEGDCVVVAGKGCEEVIMLRGKRIPWNDKNVIKDLLERPIEVEIHNDHFEKRENVCLKS
ncbi:MAG: UDP-N-acetylmuramoyl-L-alanyl-D-glutamate--2,6-diaminopimelate ligase [Candidatus Gracilibacteria bacterium]|nr:UDP-N-acetylmuramoyl-L-alanyl-D-glutamate--2,6-diaminopimelate ligase [Candidatus Gracilibacteria bacterium]